MRHRLRHAGLLAATICFLLPTAALAETLTVDPADSNGTCARTGSDTTCKTITGAVTASQGGDTIKILKGTYAESVNITGRDALKLEGAAGALISGTGTDDVLTVASNDVTVSGVAIETPANAGSALTISGTGAKVEGVQLTRNNSSTLNEPVVDVTGTATLSKAIITQNAGATGTPAVRSTGGGTTISDAIVIGVKGPAATFTSATTNKIIRSVLVSAEPTANALELTTSAAGEKKVLADSTIIVGGANASGVFAKTDTASAGNLTLDMRHVTISGASKSIVLDASSAQATFPAGAAGNITASATSSIVHGAVTAVEYAPGLNILGVANNVKLTLDTCDTAIQPNPGTNAAGEVVVTNCTNTADAAIFVPNKLTLRADSPLIDKGAAPAGEDSATDFEGEPRVTGAASDIGADEFNNKAPVAKFGITNVNPRANEIIGFGSLSTDPEQAYGGGITKWTWNFGDGKTETTTVGGVAHTYETPGTYQATLTVTDKGGLTATAPPQTITVRDGKPVDIKVSEPAKGTITLNRLPKKVKKGSKKKPKIPAALPLIAKGTAADESGVKVVQVALRLVKRNTIPKALRPAFKKIATTSAEKSCEHYVGSKGFEKRVCSKVSYFVARFKDGAWQFNTSKKFRLPPGTYELLVRATDGTDLVTVPDTKSGTLVKFTVK